MYDAALWAYEPMGNGGPNFVGRAGNSRYLPEVSPKHFRDKRWDLALWLKISYV